MYYCYILFSVRFKKIYVGSTNDLRRRVYEHNHSGLAEMKKYAPWKLVYYEAFVSEDDARKREGRLKNHGKGIAELKRRIASSLQEICQKGEG